jgi:hypothetical protein
MSRPVRGAVAERALVLDANILIRAAPSQRARQLIQRYETHWAAPYFSI